MWRNVEECVALMGMGIDDALWIQRIISKCYEFKLFINDLRLESILVLLFTTIV
jgi:hypothetical protein